MYKTHVKAISARPRLLKIAVIGAMVTIAVVTIQMHSSVAYASTNYDPTTYAEDHLTGYLWSDSPGGTNTTWSNSNANVAVRDRFYDVAVALKNKKFPGATVTKNTSSIKITNMPLSIPLDRLPTITQNALNSHDKQALIAFATSVIEGEGTQSGEIIDDPVAAHRDAFISVMTELGVRTTVYPPKPNQGIAAVQADWPIIQCWPFAAYNRVPGGAPSAGMCTGSTDTPPAITLSSPQNATSVSSGATVNITGTAADDHSLTKVDVKVDGTLVKTFTGSAASAFSTTWTAVSGSHTITATATDSANQTTTDTATITVSSPGGQPCTPPTTDYGTVTLTASVPASGTYRIWSRMAASSSTANTYLMEVDGNSCYTVGGSTVPVYASTATQHFAVNSSNWIAKTKTGSFIDISLPSGNHSLKLYGNADGVLLDRLILTQDISCTPTGTGDNCANPGDTINPVVSISSPASGTTLTTATTVKAVATDDTAVTKVDFSVDGQLKATDTMPGSGNTYTYSLDPNTLANGNHTLTATAYDAAQNNATSSPVTITVGTTPPPVVPGDTNGDGKVDFLDLSRLAAKYGQVGGDLGGADFNNSNSVDYLDFSILAAHYGQ